MTSWDEYSARTSFREGQEVRGRSHPHRQHGLCRSGVASNHTRTRGSPDSPIVGGTDWRRPSPSVPATSETRLPPLYVSGSGPSSVGSATPLRISTLRRWDQWPWWAGSPWVRLPLVSIEQDGNIVACDLSDATTSWPFRLMWRPSRRMGTGRIAGVCSGVLNTPSETGRRYGSRSRHLSGW